MMLSIPLAALALATTCSMSSGARNWPFLMFTRSEEHTSELQSQSNLVCRLLLEKKKKLKYKLHLPFWIGCILKIIDRDSVADFSCCRRISYTYTGLRIIPTSTLSESTVSILYES